jgi:RNA polymerase-binding transcription factor DksA
MATSKKAVKPAAKKTAPKKNPTPVKKAAPVKKQAKPAPKATKPVAKKSVAKPVAKKPAPKAPVKKSVAKPIAKKTVVKAVAPKKVVKPVAKKSAPVVKSKSPVNAVAKKIVVKPAAPAAKTPVAAQKPIPQTMSKKAEDKKTATKAVAAKPVAAGPKATAQNPKDIKITPAKPVSIPKISTKTSRKYQPDFTKSVLDQPKNDPGAPIVRYNDADLAEFRELIQRKLGAAKKELAYLQGLITRKDEMGGDESDNRYMTMEDGSLSMEREQLSQMASRQITFIDHLEKALMRIENKTYGICRVTSKLIDKARLRAVPHATLSIEAKMGQAK